ncbi:MAG: hypothetical protein IPM54_41420 [Polyangiaceae bacterium]|nr:hypothetical protein [Polyangiaceae bacterium]
MLAQRMVSCLVVTIGLIAVGCATEPTGNPVDGELLSVPLDTMAPGDPQDDPPGSKNGFLPACFWDPNVIEGLRKYAVGAIWTSPSNATYGTLPANSTMDLVPLACRAEALKYLARCAMPKDTFVYDTLTGDRYWGWLNLSTPWLTGALPTDDQWWVTACMLQHLNGYHVEVPLLLDGARTELYSPSASHPEFVYRDSRLWGNLFDTSTDFVAYACYEDDLNDACTEFTVVDTRICDSDPTLECNLNILGPCSDVCTPVKSGYQCPDSGMKHVGSRLKDFSSMYGTVCGP